MHNNLPEIAKHYILYRHQRAQIRDRQKQLLDGLTTRLPYTENALKVLAKRYLQRDADYNKVIETPEQMLGRVAKTLAEVERRYGKADEQIQEFENDLDILSGPQALFAFRRSARHGELIDEFVKERVKAQEEELRREVTEAIRKEVRPKIRERVERETLLDEYQWDFRIEQEEAFRSIDQMNQ
jgi:ribonucleotide reductase alpha subunit